MNHKFKLKIVAIMATLSGTAFGSCHAMQLDAGTTNEVGSGVVRPAEPAYDGAFGAVTATKPLAEFGRNGTLPPIISSGESNFWEFDPNQSQVLPPIVSSNRTMVWDQGMPPVAGVDQAQPTVATSEYQTSKKSNMLAPVTSKKRSVVPVVQAYVAETQMVAPAFDNPPLAKAPMYGNEYQSDAGLIKAQNTVANSPIIQAASAPAEFDQSTVEQAAQWGNQNQNNNPQGFSAGGVPIYSNSMPASYGTRQDVPPIVNSNIVTLPVNLPPISTNSSSVPMPPAISSSSQIVTPLNPLIGPTVDPMAPVPSAMDTTYFSAPPMEAPVIATGSSGCSSCGGAGCSTCGGGNAYGGSISGCNSCGPGGCFNDDQVANQFGNCGSVYNARRYLILDALYMDRTDGKIAVSNFGGLTDFDPAAGFRLTLGERSDAINGREISYFGTTDLEESRTVTDAAGRISIPQANVAGFGVTELSAFRNAVEQSQSKTTQFQSLEFNKVKWGWDVYKTTIGLRYIYVQDEYSIASRNLFGETGLFEVNTQNNLIGPQYGNEIFYDVGYRLSGSFGSKFGLFVNPNKVETKLFNAGAQFLDLDDPNTTVSYAIELNLTGRYQLSKNARFRFGYTALWLDELSSAADNIPTIITPTTGSATSDSDSMFFQGISLGFEIYR